MKKIWIWFILATLAFLVTLIQTGNEGEWWNIAQSFFKSIELFTFILVMPISTIFCFAGSLKLLRREKSPVYLLTLIIPPTMLGMMLFFFFARVLGVIFG